MPQYVLIILFQPLTKLTGPWVPRSFSSSATRNQSCESHSMIAIPTNLTLSRYRIMRGPNVLAKLHTPVVCIFIFRPRRVSRAWQSVACRNWHFSANLAVLQLFGSHFKPICLTKGNTETCYAVCFLVINFSNTSQNFTNVDDWFLTLKIRQVQTLLVSARLLSKLFERWHLDRRGFVSSP